MLHLVDKMPTRGIHRAETNGREVFVKRGWELGDQGLLRIAHELEHVRDMEAPHHPFWHRCVRSFWPWRRDVHRTVPLDKARELRQFKTVVLEVL